VGVETGLDLAVLDRLEKFIGCRGGVAILLLS
jgi:hypothetical protein